MKKTIKLSKSQIKWIVIGSLLILVVLVLLYFNYVVNPIIISMSEAKVRSVTQKSVSTAVYEMVNGGVVYDDLVNIHMNDAGEISMISTDSLQINQLTRELVIQAQKNLETTGEAGIFIPVGTFSGMPIFVGRGPSVKIKLLPIGNVVCNFVSEFTSAGINQTNHRIYVNIQSYVSVILPTSNKTVATTTQLLIAESIIIGKVPATYLQSNNLDEMLNLVPL